jgi:hypothetical protein
MHWNNAWLFAVTTPSNRLQRTKIKTTFSCLHIITVTGKTFLTQKRYDASHE